MLIKVQRPQNEGVSQALTQPGLVLPQASVRLHWGLLGHGSARPGGAGLPAAKVRGSQKGGGGLAPRSRWGTPRPVPLRCPVSLYLALATPTCPRRGAAGQPGSRSRRLWGLGYFGSSLEGVRGGRGGVREHFLLAGRRRGCVARLGPEAVLKIPCRFLQCSFCSGFLGMPGAGAVGLGLGRNPTPSPPGFFQLLRYHPSTENSPFQARSPRRVPAFDFTGH